MVVLFLTVGVLTPFALAQQVGIRVIAEGASELSELDLGIDVNGIPQVAYWTADNELMLASVECRTAVLRELYAQGGRYASLAPGTDASTSVVFSGFDQASGLAYAMSGGLLDQPAWAPLGFAGDWPVLALDSTGRPYVVYVDHDGGMLKFARFDIPTGKWVVEIVPGPFVEFVGTRRVATVAVDVDDRPVVAYFGGHRNSAHKIIVATRTNQGWTIRTKDLENEGGVSPENGLSLAFDTTNAPHVVYQTAPGDLKLARFGVFGVSLQTVREQQGSPVRLGPRAMHIGAGGRIRVAYFDIGAGVVMLADNLGGWTNEIVDGVTGFNDLRPALAVDATGRWAVAYLSDSEGIIEVKVAGPAVLGTLDGDCNCDNVVDLVDFVELESCLTGPAVSIMEGCECFDINGSTTVDLADVKLLQAAFGDW